MTIYLRQIDGADEPEQMSEAEWIDRAKDWVIDVDVAREVGFRSAGARYWTESK